MRLRSSITQVVFPLATGMARPSAFRPPYMVKSWPSPREYCLSSYKIHSMTSSTTTLLTTHDTTRIDDTRIGAVRPLITPALLEEKLPVPAAAEALVESSRAAISRVLHGQDDRLVVVVGPCSDRNSTR